MDSFCESLKIKITIAYAFNNVLLNWSITKEEGLKVFELILIFQGGLVCVILEYFVNFLNDPFYEQPLLWFMII